MTAGGYSELSGLPKRLVEELCEFGYVVSLVPFIAYPYRLYLSVLAARRTESWCMPRPLRGLHLAGFG